MSWGLCSSLAAVRKAGANANSTITASGAALASWSDEAEAVACAEARYDVVTNWASLTAKGKEIFQALTTALIAQNIISYDMSGYTSRMEAQTMLDVLENQVGRVLGEITDKNIKTYLAIN
jgi:hypothetical protein